MTRLGAKVHGYSRPFKSISIDTDGDPSAVRALLIEAAQQKLGYPGVIDPAAVCMYLAGGMEIEVDSLEKDDVIFFAFDGASWAEPAGEWSATPTEQPESKDAAAAEAAGLAEDKWAPATEASGNLADKLSSVTVTDEKGEQSGELSVAQSAAEEEVVVTETTAPVVAEPEQEAAAPEAAASEAEVPAPTEPVAVTPEVAAPEKALPTSERLPVTKAAKKSYADLLFSLVACRGERNAGAD